jgi:hypothetical protein
LEELKSFGILIKGDSLKEGKVKGCWEIIASMGQFKAH